MSFSREFFWVSSTDSPCLWYFYIGKNDLKIQSPAVVLGGKIPMKPLLQWRFQDSKMEVPYHIRLCFVGIFPEISAEKIGLKNRWCLGTSSLGTSIPWSLTIGCIGGSPGVLRWTVTSQHRRLFVFDAGDARRFFIHGSTWMRKHIFSFAEHRCDFSENAVVKFEDVIFVNIILIIYIYTHRYRYIMV